MAEEPLPPGPDTRPWMPHFVDDPSDVYRHGLFYSPGSAPSPPRRSKREDLLQWQHVPSSTPSAPQSMPRPPWEGGSSAPVADGAKLIESDSRDNADTWKPTAEAQETTRDHDAFEIEKEKVRQQRQLLRDIHRSRAAGSDTFMLRGWSSGEGKATGIATAGPSEDNLGSNSSDVSMADRQELLEGTQQPGVDNSTVLQTSSDDESRATGGAIGTPHSVNPNADGPGAPGGAQEDLDVLEITHGLENLTLEPDSVPVDPHGGDEADADYPRHHGGHEAGGDDTQDDGGWGARMQPSALNQALSQAIQRCKPYEWNSVSVPWAEGDDAVDIEKRATHVGQALHRAAKACTSFDRRTDSEKELDKTQWKEHLRELRAEEDRFMAEQHREDVSAAGQPIKEDPWGSFDPDFGLSASEYQANVKVMKWYEQQHEREQHERGGPRPQCCEPLAATGSAARLGGGLERESEAERRARSDAEYRRLLLKLFDEDGNFIPLVPVLVNGVWTL